MHIVFKRRAQKPTKHNEMLQPKKKTYKIGPGTGNKQEKCDLDSVADREEIMIHGLFTGTLDLRHK